MKSNKKIFEVWSENAQIANNCPEPVPAKELIPKWYKDLSRYSVGDKINISEDGAANMSVKACMPFLDTLTSGYIIKLHCGYSHIANASIQKRRLEKRKS